MIRLLAPEVANLIAAGEVVERPASIVKELVENALDAGARRIEVAFENGGVDLIRVADDGQGIPPAEVLLAFERHATSKVARAADLEAIATLGFRGEALASIAAVARVTMITSPPEGPASKVVIEGGAVIEEGRAARPSGTTVEVRGIFFNTPARRAFLKTTGTESRVLVRMVAQLALGASDVAFRVVKDGKVVLDIARGADFKGRVAAILGRETAARMIPVQSARPGIRVSGFVAAAEFARSRSEHQVLLVNGRAVTDGSLSHAVANGLGGAVPHGRSPIFALALDLDPGAVDVNVHPAKREVRFRRKDAVYAAVREAVGAAVVDVGFDVLGRSGSLPWRRPESLRPAARVGAVAPGRAIVADAVARPIPAADAPVLVATRRLRFAGELWGAYLLVEDRDRLLVIDQHAAHERVLFDEIRRGSAPAPAIQGLLVPVPLDLAPGSDPEEVCRLLEAAGFDARPGGPSSILVHGAPGTLSRWGDGEFLRELFASPESAVASADAFRDALAKSYACRGAVKFGQRLHPSEVERLLAGLEEADVPRLCPHGRPIYLELPRASLDDRFER